MSSLLASVCLRTRRRCEVPPVGDAASVGLAFFLVLLTLDRLGEHCHWQRPPGPPQVLETPRPRRDELQHRCFQPLQLMSSLLNLMLLLAELVVLPSLSHLVVELVRRWSGVVVLVWLVLVGARLVEVVVECEGLRIGTLLPRRCVMGGPGPSRPCSRDTASVLAW